MSSLAELRQRVAVSLADDATLIFTEAILNEAIHRALDEISRVLDRPLAIAGLNGAEETTLEDAYFNCLLIGASGYAVHTIMVSRFAHYTPSIQGDVNVMMRSTSLVKDFWMMLDELRVNELHLADEPPHQALGWAEPEFYDEDWSE